MPLRAMSSDGGDHPSAEVEITVASADGFCSTGRRFGVSLSKRIVNAIFLIVPHVIANKPAQMLFVQRDDVVQDLPSATSHPAFRDAILPG